MISLHNLQAGKNDIKLTNLWKHETFALAMTQYHTLIFHTTVRFNAVPKRVTWATQADQASGQKWISKRPQKQE